MREEEELAEMLAEALAAEVGDLVEVAAEAMEAPLTGAMKHGVDRRDDVRNKWNNPFVSNAIVNNEFHSYDIFSGESKYNKSQFLC